MKTVITPYQNFPIGRGQSNSLPIRADDVLAAARRHEKYLHTVSPRDYRMRVFDDGSVEFRNVKIPTLDRTFSLAEIQDGSLDFHLSPTRSLWQNIVAMWA
ncbi:hypothetical protein [Afipia sp. DC4300-2b1]|uniref:hypothetical protein n=1 Tax=Afipia sp. DC4300-2b1 TaxID=2804672 RepID=UPI003CF95C76